MRHGRPQQIAARAVHDALGLAGRSRGIKNEQRVFGVHRFGCAVSGHVGFVIPDVAGGVHGDVATGRPDDNHLVKATGNRGRFVDIGFQRHTLSAAPSFVGRHNNARIAIGDATRQRIG